MKPLAGAVVLSLVTLTGVASVSLRPEAAAAGPTPVATISSDACGQLASLRLEDVVITHAASLAEGAPVPNSGLSPMFGNAPVVGKAPVAFCRVVGRIRPTPASDIGFELWLPSTG